MLIEFNLPKSKILKTCTQQGVYDPLLHQNVRNPINPFQYVMRSRTVLQTSLYSHLIYASTLLAAIKLPGIVHRISNKFSQAAKSGNHTEPDDSLILLKIYRTNTCYILDSLLEEVLELGMHFEMLSIQYHNDWRGFHSPYYFPSQCFSHRIETSRNL